jgi:hypothetical protein
MATKKYFFPYGSFSIKDGSEIALREDKWLGNAPLREHIQLCTILCVKCNTIAKVLESSPQNVTYRRDHVGPRLASCNALLQRQASVHLMQNLHESGKFYVDS